MSLYAVVLVGLPLLLALLYGIRLKTKGRPRYDRVDRQGGTRFLGKGIKEMGYWALQPVARALVLTQVSPNQISFASLVLGLVAGICLALGHFGSAAALMIVTGLMDALDGMVARMTDQSSEIGEVLDSVIDRYVESFFLGGLIVYYRPFPIYMALALLALFGSYLVSYTTAIAVSQRVQLPHSKWNMKRPERLFYLTLGAALSPITIPWLEKSGATPVPVAHPMVAALALVAVFANSGAIDQFRETIKVLRARRMATPSLTPVSSRPGLLRSDLSVADPESRSRARQH